MVTVLGVPLKTIFEAAIAVAVAVTGFIVGLGKVKELRAKKKGLIGNPSRCLLHEARLTRVEEVIDKNVVTLTRVETKVDDMNNTVNKILDLHLSK